MHAEDAPPLFLAGGNHNRLERGIFPALRTVNQETCSRRSGWRLNLRYGFGVKIMLLFNVAEGSLTVTYPLVAPVGIVAVM